MSMWSTLRAAMLGGLVPPDATPAPSPIRRDSTIYSEAMGIGSARDKRESIRPGAPLVLADDELDWLMASPAARLITQPAQEAMRRGYRVDVDGERGVTDELDQALGVRATLVRWLETARGGRGAHILMVDDSTDWSQPMRPGAPIRALHVLGWREAVPGKMQADPREPGWMQPILWHVAPRRNVSVSVGYVHASRLISHAGIPTLPDAPQPSGIPLGYGYSMWDLYWPPLRRLWSTSATGEVAGIELTMPWIRLGSLATMMGDVAAAARDAIRMLARQRSSHGMTVLLPGDEIGRETLSLSGYSELTASAWQDVAAVRGHPLTILLGQAPAGLTSDDESARQTWERLLDVECAEYDRALRAIHTQAMGPANRHIEWGAVYMPSDLERAQADQTRAARDDILIRAGIIQPGHAAARYQGAEVLPDPVVPADWRGGIPQGIEGVTAAAIGARDADLITQADAEAMLRQSGLSVTAMPAPADDAPAPMQTPDPTQA